MSLYGLDNAWVGSASSNRRAQTSSPRSSAASRSRSPSVLGHLRRRPSGDTKPSHRSRVPYGSSDVPGAVDSVARTLTDLSVPLAALERRAAASPPLAATPGLIEVVSSAPRRVARLSGRRHSHVACSRRVVDIVTSQRVRSCPRDRRCRRSRAPRRTGNRCLPRLLPPAAASAVLAVPEGEQAEGDEQQR